MAEQPPSPPPPSSASPTSPTSPTFSTAPPPFQPQVCVVEFHHQLGPQIEFWLTPSGQALYDSNGWDLLPFMALSDGAHAMQEDFSYFTLLWKTGWRDGKGKGKVPSPTTTATTRVGKFVEELGEDDEDSALGGDVVDGDSTLFGIACTRQIRADQLKRRSADVTRSSVQKSVVVVTDRVRGMEELRTRLGIVTEMWFAQKDFEDVEILKGFQESLVEVKLGEEEGERYFGLSLREVVHELKERTLVLVKAMLLQRKILFFGSKCERLCLLQFALLSLMPGLLSHLQTSAHPSLAEPPEPPSTETEPSTNSRSSLLSTFGLPLRIFDKGAFLSPYTPLQHLDILSSYSTKSYVVGSTNSLLLQQKERYADLLVDLDEDNSITILSPSLQQALKLSAADRRWIDGITQTVNETWDENRPERPWNLGYRGSEEEIRMMFEEYILSLCSSMAYQLHTEDKTGKPIQLDDKSHHKMSTESAAQNPDSATKPESPHTNTTTQEQPQRSSTPPPTDSPSTSRHTIDATPLSPGRYTQQIDLIIASPEDNAIDFNPNFLAMWRTTHNFSLFQHHQHHNPSRSSRIFDLIEPRHPTSGGLGIEDVQRRVAQNVAQWREEYKVDERYKEGRERVGKMYELGRERLNVGLSRFWTEVERRKGGGRSNTSGSRPESRNSGGGGGGSEMGVDGEKEGVASSGGLVGLGLDHSITAEPMGSSMTSEPNQATEAGTTGTGSSWTTAWKTRANTLQARASEMQRPDAAALQASAKEGAVKAGAYLSSWGNWAKEKAESARKGREKG